MVSYTNTWIKESEHVNFVVLEVHNVFQKGPYLNVITRYRYLYIYRYK